MKKVFPDNMLDTYNFLALVTQWPSIKKLKFLKENFINFKAEEPRLRDTDSIFTLTEKEPSSSESIL